MNEAEAKTKWCPHAVASHTDPRGRTGYGRPNLGLPPETFIHACIGSACMVWRWRQEPLPAVVDDAVEGEGFCGLAGTPQ